MKNPELRIKRMNVYVSYRAQKGWGKDSIDKNLDVIQVKDDKGDWIDLPIVYENIRVTKEGVERDVY